MRRMSRARSAQFVAPKPPEGLVALPAVAGEDHGELRDIEQVYVAAGTEVERVQATLA
jgi:hypothetical protein